MKAEELRKGNYINTDSKDELRTVVEIRHSTVSVKYIRSDTNQPHQSMVEYDRLTPIPLTEEWLRRLGFDDKEYKKGFIGIDVNHMNFVLTKPHGEYDYDCFVWEYKNDIWPKYNEFKFVHELQNFFYALTGTDLTIPVSEKPLCEGA